MAPADRGLAPGDGFRHARIVDRSLLAEAGDGGVDGVRIMVAASEALAHLRFGQLAPPEHLQRVDVCAADLLCHDHDQVATESQRTQSQVFSVSFVPVWQFSGEECQRPNRVTSGGAPTFLAIWLRLMSEVVETPWTFNLNSSTLDAQRNASA